MRIYQSQSEVEKDIKNGVLEIQGDVKFECSISISASIRVIAGDINAWDIDAGNIDAGNIDAGNIDAGNIDAGDINAWDINALDITAKNITAKNITAKNINAGNIDAGNIDAGNIDAWDINARNINAGNILYYAFCCVYNSIKCVSIKAKRDKHQEPVCLDRELIIKSKEDDVEQAIKLLEAKIKEINKIKE